MTPILMLAALAGAPDPALAAPPSPAEGLKAYRARWSPTLSTCSEAPITLPPTVEAAREALWTQRAKLSSYCLMEAASLWAGDDNARAERLFMTGRVRYRYDKARCVDPKARGPYDDFHWSLTVTFSQIVVAGRTAADTPESREPLFQQVADDPATLPTDPPDERVCESGGGLIPAKKWPEQAAKIRQALLAPPK
jgi:hypothetical protein